MAGKTETVKRVTCLALSPLSRKCKMGRLAAARQRKELLLRCIGIIY
jgi:hypothetical protein